MAQNQNTQQDPDYGDYKTFVETTEGFKNWLKKVIKVNKDRVENGESPINIGVSTDYENWTAKDLKDLYFSRAWGQSLRFTALATAAGQKVNGSPTADAICAQAALTAVMPKRLAEEAKAQGKQGWELFKEMIDEGDKLSIKDPRFPAQQEYIDKQEMPTDDKNLKSPIPDKGAIDLPKLEGFGSIAPTGTPLDQQAALALLAERGVKMDAAHELKAPLETQVLEAVKNIKSVARAA